MNREKPVTPVSGTREIHRIANRIRQASASSFRAPLRPGLVELEFWGCERVAGGEVATKQGWLWL
jgi:hypothetical protein